MVRILLVDDSPSMGLLLRSIFESQHDMRVVAQATDGVDAVQLAADLAPDIISMDVRMPVMDGIEATRLIMQATPTPIVVVSAALDDPELQLNFRALEVGALAILHKPPGPMDPKFKDIARDLVGTVRAMSAIRVARRAPVNGVERKPRPSSWGRLTAPARHLPDFELVAIAASTGGPQALLELLGGFPAGFHLPMVVVQHIAPGFLSGMVEWLNRRVALCCEVAADGGVLEPGHVYFAPDGYHLKIVAPSVGLRAVIEPGAPVDQHVPSATPLFESVARSCGVHAIGVMLTGLGADGARGLLSMHNAGAITLVQSPAGCVASGMPRSALDLGAVDEVMALEVMAQRIRRLADRKADFRPTVPLTWPPR